MDPFTLNISNPNDQVKFLAMVRERILAGEPILKPVSRVVALRWINRCIAEGCSHSVVESIAKEESVSTPDFWFFRTLKAINNGKAEISDLISECFLTPVMENLGIAPLIVVGVSALAPTAIKFITNLFGERPKGALFTWSEQEMATFVNSTFKEAFLGNYPCEQSPRIVAYAFLREALKGDAKHSDPEYFLNDWWFASGYDWASNLEKTYNVNIDDRSKDANGNARKCKSSSVGGSGITTASIGWVLGIGLAGIAITGLFIMLGKEKKPTSAIQVKNEDIETVRKQFQPKTKLK